jgi:hypothetical protein
MVVVDQPLREFLDDPESRRAVATVGSRSASYVGRTTTTTSIAVAVATVTKTDESARTCAANTVVATSSIAAVHRQSPRRERDARRTFIALLVVDTCSKVDLDIRSSDERGRSHTVLQATVPAWCCHRRPIDYDSGVDACVAVARTDTASPASPDHESSGYDGNTGIDLDLDRHARVSARRGSDIRTSCIVPRTPATTTTATNDHLHGA